MDIGFSIRREYWQNGYAFEAASAVLKFGRENFGLARIVGITAPANASSIGVLEKLGLRFERIIRLEPDSPESKLFG